MHKTNAGGYTLVELMAVLAIASTLLVVAVPTFQNQVRNARMTAASTDLLSNFMFARAESIGRNNFVTVCKRNIDADACVVGDEWGWEKGWITFVDENGDGSVDSGDEVIQIHDELHNEITAYGTGGITERITYRSNGMTSLNSTQAIVVCDKRGFGENARAIVVSILGKASVLKASDTAIRNCVPS